MDGGGTYSYFRLLVLVSIRDDQLANMLPTSKESEGIANFTKGIDLNGEYWFYVALLHKLG